MYNIVKEYMEGIHAPKAEHHEAVYGYQVDLGNTSRLSGCEINIRVLPHCAVITAVLPITLREEEYYGVACRLAKYNRNRLNRDEVGVFELNYLRSRIQFMLEVPKTDSMDELHEQIDFCLNEVRRYSETMLHVVCEESEAVYEAERERVENERRAAERAALTRQYRNTPVVGKLMSILGIIDDEVEEDTLCLEAPVVPEASAQQAEEAAEAAAEEKPEAAAEEKPEAAEAEAKEEGNEAKGSADE